ncbi:MAG: hypothetical protein WC782_00185 [Methylococcaceae bacterium]|jgi:hypothetical protein
MANTSIQKPDLDWSQVRETVRMLSLSAAQVDVTMVEADASVNVLTESFAAMVEQMQSINDLLLTLESNPARDSALAHCLETSDKIEAAIVAFQFYDRMQQCLQHVTSNLKGLSLLVETPDRLYDPYEWINFQNQIRSRYTMESEKQMFDAILQGKTMTEVLALKNALKQESEGDIELF